MTDQDIRSWTEDLYPSMVAWRRQLHMHPEISFEEWKTTAFIAQRLSDMGVPYERNEGLPGLIGRIQGAQPGPNLAFRADIDALAMTEDNDLPYKSQTPGVMHACGHDVHTATLLGLACVLSRHPELVQGSVTLIFQPAEERSPGGAKPMLESGRLDDVDGYYGFHVRSTEEVGRVGFRAGPLMAAADRFSLTFSGHGGHGGRPYQTVDPIVMACQAVTALQGIVSRMVNAQDAAVLSVCQIHGGTAFNIIPDNVRLEGTVRTFSPEVQHTVMARMDGMARGIAEAYGGSYDLDYLVGYPVLCNHEAETARAQAAIAQGFPEYTQYEMPMTTGGEDFSYYLQRGRGTFFNVGGLTPGSQPQPHHNPKFLLDERCMAVALTCYLSIYGSEMGLL